MKKPPKPPRKLSIPFEVAENEIAKREWIRVAQLLEGKEDERDQSLLIDYCLTTAEIHELRRTVDIEGHVIQGPKGGSYMNPTVTVMMNRQGHLAALRRDLYFTPKSRIEKQNKASMTKAKSIKAGIAVNDDDQD